MTSHLTYNKKRLSVAQKVKMAVNAQTEKQKKEKEKEFKIEGKEESSEKNY